MAKRGNKKSGFKRKPWRIWLFSVTALLVVVALLVLDWVVRDRFSGSKWQLPAHVYARPLELYQGLSLDQGELEWELQGLGYRSAPSVTVPGSYSVSPGQMEIFTRGFEFWDIAESPQRLIVYFAGGRVTDLRTASGQRVDLIRLEPRLIGGIYPEHLEDRELLKLADVPVSLRDGLVAVEDHGFYQHWGFSLRGIGRALLANLREAEIVQGGSTLTQQLVKNFYLDERRTLIRKAIEAIMAVMLELHFSKEEILEGYLNEVYLGQEGKRAIHGFAMASRHYFKLPINELQIHQQALLIGLVKGAAYYNPWRRPDRATARRNLVLTTMAEHGLLSEQQANEAMRQPLGLANDQPAGREQYPAYMDLVKRQLREHYREEDLNSAGMKVFTNFDPQLQRQLERSVAEGLQVLEQDYSLANGTLQAGAAIVRVGTGEVVALVGDRQPGYPGFNRGLDAYRPVGSTIKPAVYLAALEQPQRYTLATLIDDSDIAIETSDGSLWQPRNFKRQSHGEVPLYEAFGYSYNQATARLGMDIGLPSVIDVMHRLGHDRSVKEVPSLLLGSVEMSVLDVAGMYHTIAAEGYRSQLRAIDSVYTAENRLLRRYPYEVERQFSAQTMHLLHYALQFVVREGTGRSAFQALPAELVVAGKTGTTNGQRDSWFTGYSGDYLGVVWLGRDDNGKMPVTGGTGALRIWRDFMAKSPQTSFQFTKPEGISYHWVDKRKAMLTGKGCRNATRLPFIAGSEPSQHNGCYRGSIRGLSDWLKQILRW